MTINFNVSPYYDDYDTSKDFLRVLFRPGYSVQARELTTLQTILQNQVTRFGNHIFENGSMVIPGSVNVNDEVNFMKLNDLQDGNSVTTYLTQFRDKVITGSISGAKALVEDTSQCGRNQFHQQLQKHALSEPFRPLKISYYLLNNQNLIHY